MRHSAAFIEKDSANKILFSAHHPFPSYIGMKACLLRLVVMPIEGTIPVLGHHFLDRNGSTATAYKCKYKKYLQNHLNKSHQQAPHRDKRTNDVNDTESGEDNSIGYAQCPDILYQRPEDAAQRTPQQTGYTNYIVNSATDTERWHKECQKKQDRDTNNQTDSHWLDGYFLTGIESEQKYLVKFDTVNLENHENHKRDHS